MSRRDWLMGLGGGSLVTPSVHGQAAAPAIVAIGGGFGGATALRYLRRLLPHAKLTLIEPATEFVSCPMSNRVIHGGIRLRDITQPYDKFVARHEIRWVRAAAHDIDATKREVRAGNERIAFDRLIVAPGVDFVYDGIAGLTPRLSATTIPHAWKAGAQTELLKRQLQGMRTGGTVAIHVPPMPFRCPPAPYERASLMAYYLAAKNPRAKVLVFDSNPEIPLKKGLFEAAWKANYRGQIEYIPNAEIEGVDATRKTLELKVQGKVTVDVLNVIPPQRASEIAVRSGLANVGQRWCGVDFLSYESSAVSNIHVLGDSVAGAPGMPKSAHIANQQAKVCAVAIAARVWGVEVPVDPIVVNTCYSFTSDKEAIHAAAVFRYDAKSKSMIAASGSGGVSSAPSSTEGLYAIAWAANILADTLE